MEEKQPPIMPIMSYFSVIRDPRVERNKLYPLYEVIVITILAVIALAQGWEDIERYAKAKERWLRRFLKLDNGDTDTPGETGAGRVYCNDRRGGLRAYI
jgi:hypothetical protein